MTSLKSKTALVYDYGQFVELAVTLSKDFGRVLYFAPWIHDGSPTSNMLRIGDGLREIERCREIWDYVDDVDLFVFPDVQEPELQKYLASIGKRVWGCRGGAELETDRSASKKISQRLGIDIAPYAEVTGIDALREYLKANKDQWVKVSHTRGDMETFHSPTYKQSEPRIDELEHSLGAQKKLMEFIVEQGINPAVEVGYDGYTIDGKFPNASLIGVESKCKAYVGSVMPYRQLPKEVRSVNEKLAPALKDYGYRGFLSTEIRIANDAAYLIDPCCRCGTPPSELYQLMIGNLAEVMWEGAAGVVVEPDYRGKYGALVLLQSEWVAGNWQHVMFPPRYRENVKLHNVTVIDGEYYVIPFTDGRAQIGAVVAYGNTADEAIARCKKIAETVKGHSIDKPLTAIDDAYANLVKLIGEDRPKSKGERKADDLRASGKISDRQYEKMMARA